MGNPSWLVGYAPVYEGASDTLTTPSDLHSLLKLLPAQAQDDIRLRDCVASAGADVDGNLQTARLLASMLFDKSVRLRKLWLGVSQVAAEAEKAPVVVRRASHLDTKTGVFNLTPGSMTEIHTASLRPVDVELSTPIASALINAGITPTQKLYAEIALLQSFSPNNDRWAFLIDGETGLCLVEAWKLGQDVPNITNLKAKLKTVVPGEYVSSLSYCTCCKAFRPTHFNCSSSRLQFTKVCSQFARTDPLEMGEIPLAQAESAGSALTTTQIGTAELFAGIVSIVREGVQDPSQAIQMISGALLHDEDQLHTALACLRLVCQAFPTVAPSALHATRQLQQKVEGILTRKSVPSIVARDAVIIYGMWAQLCEANRAYALDLVSVWAQDATCGEAVQFATSLLFPSTHKSRSELPYPREGRVAALRSSHELEDLNTLLQARLPWLHLFSKGVREAWPARLSKPMPQDWATMPFNTQPSQAANGDWVIVVCSVYPISFMPEWEPFYQLNEIRCGNVAVPVMHKFFTTEVGPPFLQQCESDPRTLDELQGMAQAADRLDKAVQGYHGVTGVTSSYLRQQCGETRKQNCLVVFVRAKGYRVLGDELLPTQFEGYPVDVQEAQFVPLMAPPPLISVVKCNWEGTVWSVNRPTGIGSSIGVAGSYGTAACIVQRKDDPSRRYVLTTVHLAPTAAPGTVLEQPGPVVRAPEQVYAHVDMDKLTTTRNIATLTAAILPQFGKAGDVDAAMYELIPTNLASNEFALDDDDVRQQCGVCPPLSTSVDSNNLVNGTNTSPWTVFKIGATTGWTKGYLNRDVVHLRFNTPQLPVNVQIAPGPKLWYSLRNQFKIDGRFAKQGDSGALVWRLVLENGGNIVAKACAMVVAGSDLFAMPNYQPHTFVTPIHAVLNALNVEIAPT